MAAVFPSARTRRFTITFHTEAALFGAALPAGMAAGFDQQAGAINGIENSLHELRHSNRDPAQAKTNARAHCGLGTGFYRAWLDTR